MATKLKNMRLTSVDLVRNGANQEADICLFKSAAPEEAPAQPTTEEKNIFKRFINWLRENPAEAGGEAVDPETVEKDYTTFDSLNTSRENNEKLWQYTNALCESIRSIQMDHDLDKDQKYQLMAQSLDQFDAAMDTLIEALCKSAPSKKTEAMVKSAPEEEEDDDWDWDDEDDWEEDGDDDDVQKYNHNHGSDGRFVSGGGGAAAGSAPVDTTKYSFKNYRNPDGQNRPGYDTYKNAVKSVSDEIEKLPNRCLNNYAGGTPPKDQMVTAARHVMTHSSVRDMVGARSEQGLKDVWSDLNQRAKYLADSLEGYNTWNKTKRTWEKGVSKSADIDDIEEV